MFPGAPTGEVVGEVLVAAATVGPSDGVVVVRAGGAVVDVVVVVDAGGATGTVVGEGAGNEVGVGVQSAMVCWKPDFATHGGPT